ncbi:uncharacterized protein LOC103316813 isoform X1 [Nasonia vitripennis]|uniref:Uncharacterized protein n=1 Tax=Nasonia vitripennis TaxID=7425 RepID=A0A7M7Q6H1_NASVI|nr:uncharacterized protein LOC103316813 isoform X1 [Nasonia vitripennis]
MQQLMHIKDHFVKMEKAQRSMKNKIITLDRKKLNFDFEKKEESVSPSLVSRTRKRIRSTAIPAFTQNQTDTNNLPESPSHASRKRKRSTSTSQGTPVLTHIETDTCTLPVSPVLVSGRRNRTSSTMTPAFKQNKIDTGNLPLSAIQALRTSKRISSTAKPAFTLNETDADNLLVSPSLVSRTRKRLSSTVTPAFTLNETDTNNLPESSSQASQKRKRSTSTPQATTILTHMEIPVSTSKKAADSGKILSSSTRQNHPKTYSVSSAATRDHLPFSPDVTPTKLAQKSVASTPPTSRNSHSNPMKPRRILAFEDNAVAGPSGVNRAKKSKEEKTLTVSTKGKFTKQVEKKRKYKKKLKNVFTILMTILTPGWRKKINSQNGRI